LGPSLPRHVSVQSLLERGIITGLARPRKSFEHFPSAGFVAAFAESADFSL
jgi:hypothetical protein